MSVIIVSMWSRSCINVNENQLSITKTSKTNSMSSADQVERESEHIETWIIEFSGIKHLLLEFIYFFFLLYCALERNFVCGILIRIAFVEDDISRFTNKHKFCIRKPLHEDDRFIDLFDRVQLYLFPLQWTIARWTIDLRLRFSITDQLIIS